MAGYPPYPPPPPPPTGQDWRYQRRILKDQARAQRDMARAQRDAYRDQLRGTRRSSIVGPLLVVGIGVVFLLVQLGYLRNIGLWMWYARFWPLLLVAIGIVLLIEWFLDRRAAQANPNVPYVRHSIGGGIIALLVLLIVSGIGASGVRDGRDLFARGFNLNSDNFEEFFGNKHESDQSLDQTFPAGTALTVTNPRGDVTVSGTSDDGKIHITLHKQVYTRSDSDAEGRARELSPQIKTQTGSYGGAFNVSLPSLDGATADLVITLPTGAPVTVTANHGDVHINSIHGPVMATANHGDIELSAINGPITTRINNGGSSMTAHDINGPVSLEGHARDLTLSEINGPVSLSGDFFGTTHLEHIRGGIRFHTSRTDFQLARLDGDLDVSSSNISAGQAQGPVTLTTRSRNITLDRIAGDLSVTNSNGSVDLTAAPPLGNVTIQNRRGTVNLTVPDAAAFTVQAQTTDGDIQNDFALPTQESDSRKSFAGTIGKGGSLIRITTTEGDVAFKKASLAPLPPLPPPPPPITPTPQGLTILGPNRGSAGGAFGDQVIVTKGGTRITSGPDGSSVIITKDGTHITSGADGNSVYSGKDGTHLTIGPDGTTIYIGRDGTRYTARPDGTKIYAGRDGTRITATPDGQTVAIGRNGQTLSDLESRDQLRHAEDLVRQTQETQRRESAAGKDR